MKIKLIILTVLSLSFISCKKESGAVFSSNSGNNTGPVITPISEDKCDNSIDFAGAIEVTDITDTSAKIKWNLDTNSIGYTVFKQTENGLEIVANTTNMETETFITNLSEESTYQFLVRTINSEGAYDCNTNYQEVITTEKQTFISCHEINEYYQNTKPSDIYEIDPDKTGPNAPFDVYCDMDNNSGGWTKVFQHNTADGYFANDAEAKESNISDPNADKYSILTKMEDFMREGKYEFWIYYPEHDGVDGGNRWTQISNPVTDPISGYVSINEDYTDMHWGGLEKSSYSGTLIDGSVSHGWWFYAIGANRQWPSAGSIPGPIRNSGVTKVQLFVK